MEVPLVGSDVIQWIQVKVLSKFVPGTPCCPPPRDCSGTASIGNSLFLWRLHAASPAVLELLQLSSENEMQRSGLKLLVEEPLSPFAAIFLREVDQQEGVLCLCVITISGVVYSIRVKPFHYYQNGSILEQVDIAQFSLLDDIAHLNHITAFASGGGYLCVGGQNGSIICYPLGQPEDIVQGLSFELRDGDARFGRLWSLITRGSKVAGEIKCLTLQLCQDKTVLFVLHNDGSFKLWDLANRRRLFSCNLSGMTGSFAKMMRINEFDENTGIVRIASVFCGILDNSGEMIQIHDFHIPQGDGGIFRSSLMLQRTLPCEEGTVVDVKLFAENYWVLQDLGTGLFALIYGNIKGDEVPQHCALLEIEVADQLLQGPDYDWDDLILMWQTIFPDVKDIRTPSLSEIFFSRLFQPGVLQQNLLRELLATRNRQIVEYTFSTLTKDGLQKEILAAIDAENIGDNGFRLLSGWKTLYQDYFASWTKSNVPYGLLLDSSLGTVGLIRRNSISVLRFIGGIEQLHDGRTIYIQSKIDTVPSGRQGCCHETSTLGALHRCMERISKHLGKMALAVFQHTLLGPKHVPLSHLTSIFLHLLDVGYDVTSLSHGISHMGVDSARQRGRDLHLRQRKFQLHMLCALQDLRDAGSGWEKVVEAVGKYVECFIYDMKDTNTRMTTKDWVHRNINRRLIAKTTCQVSCSQFEAARDLLLVLGYIVNVKGQVGIGPNEISKIQLQLIPKVQELLMFNLSLYWLTITFVELPPTEDFNSRLSSLNIDGNSSKKACNGRIGLGELTLCEILLSSYLSTSAEWHTPNSGNVLSTETLLRSAMEFIHWLFLGDKSHPLPFFSKRVVSLSIILLQHGQYGALEEFLSIIQDFAAQQKLTYTAHNADEWSAHMQLLGFCLLAQAHTSLHGSFKEEQVAEAIRYFFRAASSFGEPNDVLSAIFLETGLRILLPNDVTPATAAAAAAAWKLHYFEWVMQIFEQYRLSDGACQFAHAALEQVDEAVGALREVRVERSNAGSLASTIKGRLWANVFKFYLELKLYREAYCAIISNPDSESKYICLRRFIVVLCERRVTGVLCSIELPYTGMLDRVELELAWKAQYADIASNPSPYKILYSFHMYRHNWRSAAYCMYKYSVRMKEEGISRAHLQLTFTLQERVNGLVAAINALHLVSPSYAWIDMHSQNSLTKPCQAPTKRSRVHAEDDGAIVLYRSESKIKQVVDLHELEKEYTLTLAQLQLAQANAMHPLLGGSLPPSDVLALLAESGVYEMAFSVVFLFWKNSSLKRELEKVFRIMAEKCCIQQIQAGSLAVNQDSLEPSKKFLMEPFSEAIALIGSAASGVDSSTFDHSSGRNNWRMLQIYLEKYTRLHSGLPTVVAETMLSIDRLMVLPVWLVNMFKGGRHATAHGMAGQGADPAALLRLYLDFGHFTEATFLLLEYINAWANLSPVDVIKRKRVCAIWFPYTLVDRLKCHLSKLKNINQYERLQSLLNSALQKHFDQINTDSNDIASLVQRSSA